MIGFGTVKQTLVSSLVAFAVCSLMPAIANDRVANGIQYASYTQPESRLDIESAVQKINAIRHRQGLKGVKVDPALMNAAQIHAHDLARLDDVSHYGTDGSSPVDRVFKAGYSGVMTGENVSAGQRDLDEVLDGWLKSSSHRKTLLMKEAQHVGVALAYDPKTTYRTFWTLVIAEPF